MMGLVKEKKETALIISIKILNKYTINVRYPTSFSIFLGQLDSSRELSFLEKGIIAQMALQATSSLWLPSLLRTSLSDFPISFFLNFLNQLIE